MTSPRFFNTWHRAVQEFLTPEIHLKCNDNAASNTITNSGSIEKDGVSGADTNTFSVEGKIGTGFVFTGSNHFAGKWLNLNTFLSDISSDGIGSICLWFIMPSTYSYNNAPFFSFQSNLPTTDGHLIMSPSALNKVFINLKRNDNDSLTESWNWTSDTLEAPLEWNHIMIIQDGVSRQIYINNNINGSFGSVYNPRPGDWLHDFNGAADKFHMGMDSNLAKRGWDMKVDDFRYYNVALTEAQRNFIYNSGNGTEEDIVSGVSYI